MSRKNILKFDFKDAYKKLFSSLTFSLLSVMLNILISILVYSANIKEYHPDLYTIICILLIVMFITSVFSVWNEHKKQNIYIYHEYLQNELENNNLQKERNDLLDITFEAREFLNSVFSFLILSKKESSIQIFKSGNITEAKNLLNQYLKDYLFYRLRYFFGYHKDENFSIAIYLYDSEQELLWDFLSKKDKKINKEEDSGRDWKRTDCSHIAICFNHEIELIHSDIPKRLKEFGLSTKSFQGNDIENYKSAITLPLYFRRNDQKQVIGVFCITSDKFDTFHEPSEDEITDPIYSIKLSTLRILVEILSENLSLLYEKNIKNIKKTKNAITN